MNLFHGSETEIQEITESGIFGGLFATSSESSASSHGRILHTIEASRVLTDYELNYEIEGAWEAALEICDGDEEKAEAIMSAGCESLESCDPEDAAEQGWELQRLRGLLASRLGFDAVEMLDEHGTVYLCLPTCRVSQS